MTTEQKEQYRQLLAQMSKARRANGVELDMLVQAIDVLLDEVDRLQAQVNRLDALTESAQYSRDAELDLLDMLGDME